jgi:hypothetical protein
MVLQGWFAVVGLICLVAAPVGAPADRPRAGLGYGRRITRRRAKAAIISLQWAHFPV